jgi:hypothetical protein
MSARPAPRKLQTPLQEVEPPVRWRTVPLGNISQHPQHYKTLYWIRGPFDADGFELVTINLKPRLLK